MASRSPSLARIGRVPGSPGIHSRRTAAPVAAPLVLLLALAVTSSTSPATGSEPKYALTQEPAAGQLRQFQAQLEVDGHVKLKADPKGEQVTKLPMKLRGSLKFDERLVAAPETLVGRQAIRYYRDIGIEVELSGGTLKPRLSDGSRWVLSAVEETGVEHGGALGPLERDELDLVAIQADPLLWAALLPAQEVAVGDQWTPEAERMGAWFGVTRVQKAELTATLESVKGKIAQITAKGEIVGSCEGVATDIKTHIVARFDTRTREFLQIALTFNERRDVGHARPGLETRAKLTLHARRLSESPNELGSAALRSLALDQAAAGELVLRPQFGGFQVTHSRNWHVMLDRPDSVILRHVDRGDFVAQCHFAMLPEKRAQVTLEGFQADVAKALANRNANIVSSSEGANSRGVRVLRVVAEGSVEQKVSLRWIYCYAEDQQGQRASFVFVVQEQMVERFGEGDKQIIDTFQFAPRIEPQPAPKQTAELPGTQSVLKK